MSWSLRIPSFHVVIQGFRKVSWSQWTLYLWRTWEKRVRPIRQACAQVKGTCCAGVRTPRFALEICSACRSRDAARACREKLTNNKNKGDKSYYRTRAQCVWGFPLVYFCDSRANQYSVLKHQLDLTQTDASTELHATSNVCKHTPCEHRVCVSACIK